MNAEDVAEDVAEVCWTRFPLIGKVFGHGIGSCRP